MRILTFIHGFEPGGVEKVALRLVSAWRDSGAAVSIIVGKDNADYRAAAPALPYAFLPESRWIPGKSLKMLRWLPGLIRRHRPDVIFVGGNTYTIFAVLLKLLLGRSCPPIVAKVSNDLGRDDMGPLSRFFYRKWLRIQGRHIDHLVGMADANRAEIVAAFDVATERVSIVPDPALSAAQLDLLSSRGPLRIDRSHSGQTFLAVGRLVQQKNFALLIEAFADIARADDRLVILGEGVQRGKLERLVAELHLESQVSLPGHGSADDWLARADTFVLSSDYEGVPAVVIEALAAGLPIVATQCSVAMSELLGNGRLGTLVPTGDREAFGHAMRQANASPISLPDMKRQAARFTIEKGAPDYLDIFRRVLESPGLDGQAPDRMRDNRASVAREVLAADRL
ncbi:glycosyltransferase [Sphingomonas sp. CA1-15]|uniref:Glycosyltransferase n=2 Tax=Sphingomonas immobilis TaxID=3063997 RepID=A0ABT8ZT08_9SPHN|nr:glycosyltransferase [Sphingomonas sp. CA1-15]MDO7840699.1 glycosyltransferase [Sphingomonas sp. CA1-15]